MEGEEIVVRFTGVGDCYIPPQIFTEFGYTPITIEPKFKKSPAEVKLDRELVSIDGSRSPPFAIYDKNDDDGGDDDDDEDYRPLWLATRPQRLRKKYLNKNRSSSEPRDHSGEVLSAPGKAFPAWGWLSYERMSEPMKNAFVTISEDMTAHLTTVSKSMDAQTLQKLKGSFNVALEKYEVDALFDALLRHIVDFYPRFCNPQVSRGRDALYKLVDIVSYLNSYEFEKINGYKLTVQHINRVFSDYCTHAYPYPTTGIKYSQRILRYLFICFNTFALHLTDKKLMTDTLPANKAIEAMIIMSPHCVNHESILIGSQWIKRCARDLLRYNEQLVANWSVAWKHILEYQSEYARLVKEYGEVFRQHEVAITVARQAMESAEPDLKMKHLKFKISREKHLEAKLNEITFDGPDLGPCGLHEEIRRVRAQMLETKDRNKRTQLETELWKKMEMADGQSRIMGTAKQADDLTRAVERRWEQLHQRESPFTESDRFSEELTPPYFE